jgi:glycosyltransferase involved in cell wall biosynthesis
MRLVGLSPAHIFSGFEKSFFEAIESRGLTITRKQVEIPWFKMWCTLTSFNISKKVWGTQRDRNYHTTVSAFKVKSLAAERIVKNLQDSADAIYQVGTLWNPLSDGITIPLVLQVDYTSLLSKKRDSEWKRREGVEQDFWVEQEKKLYQSAAIVLTTTENARQSILHDYSIPKEHVVTVGGGVSSPYDNLEQDRKPDYSSHKILFVGKGYHGKGLDTILDSFTEVRKQLPNARLTIVGPTNLSVDMEGVDYLGRIANRDQVKELYYDHALFVMPSRFEPLGQVFLEAMSCQVPCIGTTLDAMPEIIDHGKSGFLIDPGDHQQLAQFMVRILSDPELAREMGNNGFSRLKKFYTWDVVGKKIVDTIRNCI